MTFLKNLYDRTQSQIDHQQCEMLRIYPGFTVLNTDPYVGYLEGFLAPEVCDDIIVHSRPHLTPSRVGNTDKTSGTQTGWRTAHDCPLPSAFSHVPEQIAQVVKHSTSQFELTSVICYYPGGEYKPHYDAVADAHTSHGGQRVLTALIYLNHNQGGTYFPNLDISVDAVPGRLLVFHNVGENANHPHPGSYHQGLPAEPGEKWIISQWVRMLRKHQRQDVAGKEPQRRVRFVDK